MADLLLVAAVISAIAAIVAGHYQSAAYRWLKPLPLLLMAATLMQAFAINVPVLLIVYFFFCWLGDVALLSRKGFLLGLLAFLVAHGVLLWLLSVELQISLASWTGLALLALALGGTIARWLNPERPLMLYAVWFYAATLLMLLIVALCLFWQRDDVWRSVLIWVALFVSSDLLLAYNRFRQSFRSAQLWILSTYFGSQLGWVWFWPTALQTSFNGYFN